MCYAMQSQKGFSLSSLLMWLVVIVITTIFGMKLTPVYIEYVTIKKTLVALKNDYSLNNASPKAIRRSFNKHAIVDNIESVTWRDIEIKKKNKQLILTASYSKTIPLFANISLLIDFDATSED